MEFSRQKYWSRLPFLPPGEMSIFLIELFFFFFYNELHELFVYFGD